MEPDKPEVLTKERGSLWIEAAAMQDRFKDARTAGGCDPEGSLEFYLDLVLPVAIGELLARLDLLEGGRNKRCENCHETAPHYARGMCSRCWRAWYQRERYRGLHPRALAARRKQMRETAAVRRKAVKTTRKRTK